MPIQPAPRTTSLISQGTVEDHSGKGWGLYVSRKNSVLRVDGSGSPPKPSSSPSENDWQLTAVTSTCIWFKGWPPRARNDEEWPSWGALVKSVFWGLNNQNKMRVGALFMCIPLHRLHHVCLNTNVSWIWSLELCESWTWPNWHVASNVFSQGANSSQARPFLEGSMA